MTYDRNKVFKSGCIQSKIAARDERLRRLVSSLLAGGEAMKISQIAKRCKTGEEIARAYFAEHGASHKILDVGERHHSATSKRPLPR